MSIEVICESCKTVLTLDDEFAGQTGKCFKCGNEFPIPTESEYNEINEEAQKPDMPILAIASSLISALVGVLIWAAIAYFANLEVGYVAWGIGLLVGVASAKTGGKGPAMGVVCALLTLLSIFGGKMLATDYIIKKELRTYMTHELYDEFKFDSDAFQKLPADLSDKDIMQFMQEHNYDYDENGNKRNITSQDLATFKAQNIPSFKSFAEDNPTFEEWQDDCVKYSLDVPIYSLVIDDLNLIDIVFALLGVCTAYGLVSTKKEARPRRRRKKTIKKDA